MEKNMNESMLWYKFFNYIKLPISIAFTVWYIAIDYSFNKFLWDKAGLIVWFSIVAIAVLYTILLYKMYYKEKDTYFYFIVCLIIDIFIILASRYALDMIIKNRVITVIILAFVSTIWFIANCAYINDRKNIFKSENN